MKRVIIIALLAASFSACKNQNSDYTEGETMDSVSTDMSGDANQTDGTNMTDTSMNGNSSGPSSYNSGTSYPTDTAK